MTTLDYVRRLVLPAAFGLLPATMNTADARAMVTAAGLQESLFRDRRQVIGEGRFGPARGFWQFEIGGGVTGVLTHPLTRPHIERVLEQLRVVPAASACYTAIEHNDILAAVFARLNLLWLPGRLPGRTQTAKGWAQYVQAWRPGKERPETWPANFALAWALEEQQ